MARDSCLARVTAGVAIGGAVGGAVGNPKSFSLFLPFSLLPLNPNTKKRKKEKH